MPGGVLPTRLVAIGTEDKRGAPAIAQSLSQYLRRDKVPVIGRISGRVLLLDPRSVLPEEDAAVLRALRGAADAIIPPGDRAKKG